LAELPELDSVVAHNTKVTGASFPKFKTWPRWRIVYLRGGDSPSCRELLPALKNNPALQELALNMAWTDDDLAHMATNKELQSLAIDSGKAITNRGLAYLSGLTKLRLLDIQGCQATDDGIDHLLGLKDLEHFAIPKNVTDMVADQFACSPS